MSRLWTGFRSVFADGIQAFLAYKRALGRQYRAEESALRLFDRFLVQRCISTAADVTPATIDDFLVSRPRPAPRSYNHLHSTLVRFFDWMIRQVSTVIQNSPTRGHRKFPHPWFESIDDRSACGGCGQAVCGLSKALWSRLRVHIAGSVHRLPSLTLPLWSA